MRAMLLLVLLLAILALFSFYEPLAPYWKSRFPAVMSCLDEGRYGNALAAAMTGDVPGDDTEYWKKSEPLGEAGPVKQPALVEDAAPAEEIAPGGGAAPENEPPPVDTTKPATEAVSDR